MKIITQINLLIIAIVLSTIQTVFGQTTFQVCKTQVADTLLAEMPYEDILKAKLFDINEREWRNDSENSFTKRKLEDYARKDYPLIQSEINPFAMAVKLAHAQHRPLVISPDMVWLLMMQGLAKHVDLNSEELRELFVDFDGKKMLNVRRNDYVKGQPYDWESVFPEFEEQIGYYTNDELDKLLGQSFSTTTTVEMAAFQITLMDAMSSFFHYSMSVMCGIPEITIEGTTEDWEEIETLAKDFKQYKLDWWIDPLLPVLHEFTLASKGDVNQEFWAKIYDEDHVIEDLVCAEKSHEYLTGWLLNFYPYIKGEKNPYITGKIKLPRNIEPQKGTGIEIEDLPQGLSKAIFLLDYYGAKYNMEFLSGFVGIKQDADTKALRPEISWAVIDTQTKPGQKLLEAYEKFLKERGTN